jgi:hypothetical protein
MDHDPTCTPGCSHAETRWLGPPDTGWTDLPPDPQDAVTLDNDVLGARLWGPPQQPTLSLGKSDLWDRRWRGDQQPPVPLAHIRELAESDRLDEIAPSPNDTVYSPAYRYDFPCPKPGAQLILGLPFAEHAQIAPASDRGWWLRTEGQGKRLLARVWIPLSRVVAVLELYPDGVTAEDMWARVYRHTDTVEPGQPVDPTLGGQPAPGDFEPMAPPRCYVADAALSASAARDPVQLFGIMQDFPAETTFPQGFRAVVLAALSGVTSEVKEQEDQVGLGTPLWAPEEGRMSHGVIKRYTPINEAKGAASTARIGRGAMPVALFATIQTSQDSETPRQAGNQVLAAAVELGLEGLHMEEDAALAQAQRPHRARAKVSADTVLEAPPLTVPSLRTAGGHYGDVPLCSVGSTRLWFQDTALWHNDFHLNEIRATPSLTLGQFEEVRAFADMIHTLLPQAQENARDAYALPGAMYPLVHFPLRCRGVARANITWELDLGLNGLVSKPLWLYYLYTGDRAFLRELAYPVMAEGARFCAAYLGEGEDGSLHLEPTVSPEHWGLTPHFERNRDCTSALTLTRYLLQAAAQAARLLGCDSAEAAAWVEMAGRLTAYPTWESPSGPVWVDVAGAPPIEYNIPVPLSPLYWGDDVGLDSTPSTLELAHRTLEQIQVWEPHSFYLDRHVRPRLGLPPTVQPLGPENLLLSYQSIHLFPAVPSDAKIEMENFRAQGGFRVSARLGDGQITDVHLHSELGTPCRLAHPWPGCALEVRTEPGGTVVGGAGEAETHAGFATEAGQAYSVGPAAD